MTKQNAVSLQIPLKPNVDLVKLDKFLAKRETSRRGNPQMKGKGNEKPFFDFSRVNTVHLARWVIVPSDPKKNIGTSLFYSANIDGTEANHLNTITTTKQLKDDLNEILDHCAGFDKVDKDNSSSVVAYLKKYSIKTQGFYVGAPNRSVEQIKNEVKLYDHLREFVGKNGKKWKTKREAYKAIKANLANDPQWNWARKHYELPKINFLMTGLLVLLLLAILPLLILYIIVLQIVEWNYKGFEMTQSDLNQDRLTALKDEEDFIYQNQLSQIFEVKSGLRRIGLKLFLFIVTYGGKYLFVKGVLFHTPTIHFARWVLLDNGKRFIFFSNFDGSYDEYLGDFVDHNGWGLNSIYGAAVGYPRTLFMFAGGSYKIAEFMGWGRKTQVSTQIWYSAYPWHGLQQIVDKSKLRTELFNSGDLSDEKIAEMLRRI